jgi:hypothetical protein
MPPTKMEAESLNFGVPQRDAEERLLWVDHLGPLHLRQGIHRRRRLRSICNQRSEGLLSNWFYDIFIGTAPREQPAVVLRSGLRSYKVLVMREYSGHEDLRGSGRRSVIPYVYG